MSYELISMTLEEIKQAIEKLPREEFFELARRLSARYPELWQEQVARDAQGVKFDAVFADSDEELKRGDIRPM